MIWLYQAGSHIQREDEAMMAYTVYSDLIERSPGVFEAAPGAEIDHVIREAIIRARTEQRFVVVIFNEIALTIENVYPIQDDGYFETVKQNYMRQREERHMKHEIGKASLRIKQHPTASR